jgi:hypothetical protein
MGDASKRVSAACGLALGAAAAAAAAAAATAAAAAAAIAPRRGDAYVDARWRMLSRYRYAHRGLHDLDAGIPENSLPAFCRAREMGYGAELDVHLTADDRLVVIHDSDLTRLCGTSRIVEDLTLDALRDLRLSGTEQTIPTLEEVLAIFEHDGGGPSAHGAASAAALRRDRHRARRADKLSRPRVARALEGRASTSGARPVAERPVAGRPATPLIIELKTWNGNAARLASRTMELLDSRCVSYCIESFDPYALAWLRRNRPEVIRGQLSMDFRGGKTIGHAYEFALTMLLKNHVSRPDFVAYCFEDRELPGPRLAFGPLGAKRALWTIRSAADLATCDAEGAVAIFEGFLPDQR